MTIAPPRALLSPERLYRTVSIAEAVTWTLLIIGLIAKYVLDFEYLVFPFGLTHGIVFVSYAATALIVGLNQRWSAAQVLIAVATAVVPFATIPLDKSLERRRMLDGGWRTAAGDDPRDSSVIDRVLRWGLRRPLLLTGLMVTAVAVVVVVLLWLGPPTEWGS